MKPFDKIRDLLKNKFFILVFLLLLILIALIILIFKNNADSSSNSNANQTNTLPTNTIAPSATPTPIEKSVVSTQKSTITFTNTGYHFTITYPRYGKDFLNCTDLKNSKQSDVELTYFDSTTDNIGFISSLNAFSSSTGANGFADYSTCKLITNSSIVIEAHNSTQSNLVYSVQFVKFAYGKAQNDADLKKIVDNALVESNETSYWSIGNKKLVANQTDVYKVSLVNTDPENYGGGMYDFFYSTKYGEAVLTLGGQYYIFDNEMPVVSFAK